MLARASAREREMAVRLALGASRGRVIRQLLSESLLLAAVGAALGAWLARLLSQSIVRFLSGEGASLRLDLSTDWRMLAFTATVSILTCIIFGLTPALRSSRIEPGAAIKAGGRGLTAGRERFSFQRLLVVSQIAVSLVLLVGALLFVRSFRNLAMLNPGFQQHGILVTFLDLSRLHVPSDRMYSFQRDLLDRIRATPQVEAAAITTNVPLSGTSWTMGVRVVGTEGERKSASKVTWVSPDYFRTMEIPLLAGRDFNARDTATSRRVALVNETFIRKVLEGANPIGRTLQTSPEPNFPETVYEIIGIVKDTKYAGLREAIQPISFVPLSQHPNLGQFMGMVLRSSAPMSGVVSAIKKMMSEMNPEIATEFRVLQTQIQEGLVRERLMAALSGFFGVLAALLAAIGLYGVISYIVVRRRNEIGIRMALGASSLQVLGLILREATALLMAGVAVGIVFSLAAARSARALLFGLEPHDPLTLITAVSLLATITVLASYLPARRAARLDPMVALRDE
jgi:predicted permease